MPPDAPAPRHLWPTLSLPWQICIEEAWAAYCAGSVPVGAVVAGPDGRILARGRNHIFDDGVGEGHIHRHKLAHAEMNALLAFDHAQVDAHTCILYTSMEPCPLCLGAFYMSGVRELHYAARDPYAGSVNLLGTTPYLQRKPICAFGPADGSPWPGNWTRADLETILIALSTEFILRDSPGRVSTVLEEWAAVIPQGVILGQRLSQTGLLSRMREAHLPTPEMLDQLLPLLR